MKKILCFSLSLMLLFSTAFIIPASAAEKTLTFEGKKIVTKTLKQGGYRWKMTANGSMTCLVYDTKEAAENMDSRHIVGTNRIETKQGKNSVNFSIITTFAQKYYFVYLAEGYGKYKEYPKIKVTEELTYYPTGGTLTFGKNFKGSSPAGKCETYGPQGSNSKDFSFRGSVYKMNVEESGLIDFKITTQLADNDDAEHYKNKNSDDYNKFFVVILDEKYNYLAETRVGYDGDTLMPAKSLALTKGVYYIGVPEIREDLFACYNIKANFVARKFDGGTNIDKAKALTLGKEVKGLLYLNKNSKKYASYYKFTIKDKKGAKVKLSLNYGTFTQSPFELKLFQKPVNNAQFIKTWNFSSPFKTKKWNFTTQKLAKGTYYIMIGKLKEESSCQYALTVK